METFDIYENIIARTGGDISIGVVGPVRTGKSTFIKNFMEKLVLPNIKDEHKRAEVKGALPTIGDGKTITTTKPKYVPDNGVQVAFSDNVSANIRLIDSVGYMIDGADGESVDGQEVYVTTPWNDDKMSLKEAGEYCVRKAISEHSAIGIVVITDGSITGIDRASYEESEGRVINDMASLGKPFVIVLNCKEPHSKSSKELEGKLNEKYHAPIVALNVKEMTKSDIDKVLTKVLFEFPIKSIEMDIPTYMQGLNQDNEIISDIANSILDKARIMTRMSDAKVLNDISDTSKYLDKVVDANVDFGNGVITYEVKAKDGLFYDVISSESGVKISNDYELVSYIKRLKEAESVFNKVGDAMECAKASGYGVVEPQLSDVTIGEPTLYKKGSKCQVKLGVKAESLHIIKVDIDTEICPAMGTEDQCNEMIEYINKESQNSDIMSVNIFNKPLNKLVESELDSRLNQIGEDTKSKMTKAMSRMVNKGKGGVLLVLI